MRWSYFYHGAQDLKGSQWPVPLFFYQKKDQISDLINKQKIRKNKKYDVLDNTIIKFVKIKR